MKPESIVARVFGLELREIDDRSGPETIEDWDSLGHLNLVMELETAYGIELSTDEALEIVDVASLKRVLAERGATW